VRFISLLLKPLSYGYGLVLKLRHWLYDRGFLASYSFDFPVIVIGNLSLGGSGKTPMTIYLADSLAEKIQTIILSRGYGRVTTGFLEVEQVNQPKKYGDEPCLIKSKNDKTRNFVGEDRVEAIRKIDKLIPGQKVIILDDAFQHRKLKAGLNILLTDFETVFSEDELVPYGKLRDINRLKI
jgi:tetraacyldisaccharide 4'-kinase